MASYTCRGCDMPPVPTKWKGPCPGCGGFWSIVPAREVEAESQDTIAMLSQVPDPERISSVPAFDKVIGGGMVVGKHDGSSIFVFGPKGTGKTTLLMDVLERVAQSGQPVMYASGEMSTRDIGIFAKRMGIGSERLHVRGLDGDIYAICEACEEKRVKVLVVDSLQTAQLTDVKGSEGSDEQVKEVANYLTAWAKHEKVCVIMVGHMLKDGTAAGPERVGHLCDTVLEFFPYDVDGDPLDVAWVEKWPKKRRSEEDEPELVLIPEAKDLRVLECVGKNRYGETGVAEVFLMTPVGVRPYKRSKLSVVS